MKNHSFLWTIIRITIALVVIFTIMKFCGITMADVKAFISTGFNTLKEGINQIKAGA